MTVAAPGLMVCGTTSNAGKTTIVAGLCRLLADHGLRVAPFKAQNMALNSAVTATGHEIGRAQYLQAQAAGVVPEVAMNPILLKPTGERASQVVVNGRPVGVMSAAEYHEAKPELFAMVCDTLADLRSRYDAVIVEGAGSPAEINLLAHDIVNLRLAHAAAIPAIVVGDIDPGGVFASLAGTVAVLPPELAALIKAFVINKFRGDPALLFDGTDQLEDITGVPTLGVIPMLSDLRLDAEDSLALDAPPLPIGADQERDRSEHSNNVSDAVLDVAVVRFPRISNFTDIDPLHHEPAVAVRYVSSVRELGRPDLIVLPGTKATVEDLAWMRERGLDLAVAESKATVLGICGGYQMLGSHISDDVESGHGRVDGLGLLAVSTHFESDKVLAHRHGTALGEPVAGYQIHHGRVRPDEAATADATPQPWLFLDDEAEGVSHGQRFGTTLHGVLDSDGFRRRFLDTVAEHAGITIATSSEPFESVRQTNVARLAASIAEHVDLERLWSLMDLTLDTLDEGSAETRGDQTLASSNTSDTTVTHLDASPDSSASSSLAPPSPTTKVATQP